MYPEVQLPSGERLPIGGSALQCKIAEAAVDLFSSRGAQATTVRDITTACGLTPGALYNHFDSKDHLLYVLIRDIHLQVDAQMARVVAGAGADPAAQLAATVRFLVAHTSGSKQRSRVANREFTVLTGPWRSEIRDLRRQMRERLTGILLAGAEQGIFDLPGGNGLGAAMLTSATISNVCVHISEWTLEHHSLSLADLQDRFVLMAMRLAGAAS
jgi:TetR/AcrR family transcriptional regulator, cholesterol catabolism regulator